MQDKMPLEIASVEVTEREPEDAHAARAFAARRDQIEHEDNLIGMRVNWLVAAETFLFVAYAIVVNGRSFSNRLAVRKQNPDYSVEARHLYDLVPWLGVGLVLCVAISVTAAIYANFNLQRKCPPVPKDFPPLASSRRTHFAGYFGAGGIPVVVLLAWLFILITR